jgi:[ribosomal protein S5]-alanine N-acetyltransferase
MSSAQFFPFEGLPTVRLVLRAASRAYAPALLAYCVDNRAHLKRWEPFRPDDSYTLRTVETRLATMEREMAAQSALHLLLVGKDSGELIGCCNFTNIVRGVFEACHLGFSIAHSHEGQGLMREALVAGIGHVFGTLGLHRIMANHLPANERSARLLAQLGFEREGLARAYLRIDGVWADHVLTSLINPADRPTV